MEQWRDRKLPPEPWWKRFLRWLLGLILPLLAALSISLPYVTKLISVWLEGRTILQLLSQ